MYTTQQITQMYLMLHLVVSINLKSHYNLFTSVTQQHLSSKLKLLGYHSFRVCCNLKLGSPIMCSDTIRFLLTSLLHRYFDSIDFVCP